MVIGLPQFQFHFAGLEECFILIGGAACDLWLGDLGLPFRATKDLDIVLIVENIERHPEFYTQFWDFIRLGGYAGSHSGEERKNLYRFEKPTQADFPVMIELLSRNVLAVPVGVRIVRIPSGGDISSLSAILLEPEYYAYVRACQITITSVPTIPASCLIPLKARAHLDLAQRSAGGDMKVKKDDIKKHRNDVFRLLLGIPPADRFTIPPTLQTDLRRFIAKFPPESEDWKTIRQAVKNLPGDTAAVLAQLRANFQLEAALR